MCHKNRSSLDRGDAPRTQQWWTGWRSLVTAAWLPLAQQLFGGGACTTANWRLHHWYMKWRNTHTHRRGDKSVCVWILTLSDVRWEWGGQLPLTHNFYVQGSISTDVCDVTMISEEDKEDVKCVCRWQPSFTVQYWRVWLMMSLVVCGQRGSVFRGASQWLQTFLKTNPFSVVTRTDVCLRVHQPTVTLIDFQHLFTPVQRY